MLLSRYLAFCFSFPHVCLLSSLSPAICHSLLFSSYVPVLLCVQYNNTDRHKLTTTTTTQYIQGTLVTSHIDACLRRHVSVGSYSLSSLCTMPSVGCSGRMHCEGVASDVMALSITCVSVRVQVYAPVPVLCLACFVN